MRGARDAGRVRTPVVRNARDAGRVRTPVVRGARRREPSPMPERVPVVARRARRVPCRNESRSMPVVPTSPVRERVPVDARHLPCPGPTYACSRRRQPLCCEHIFACTPWRFITARPAARLRRIVGPLAARHTVPNRPGSRRDRASPRIIGDNRTSSDIIEQSNITEHIANLNQL